MDSIHLGITTSFNFGQAKAPLPISFNVDGKVMDFNEEQLSNALLPIDTTPSGIINSDKFVL